MEEWKLETEGLFRIRSQRFQAREIWVKYKWKEFTACLGGVKSIPLIFEGKCPGGGLEVRHGGLCISKFGMWICFFEVSVGLGKQATLCSM